MVVEKVSDLLLYYMDSRFFTLIEKNLNPHKAAGPDNIRPMVLKELVSEISPILSTIYNVSIKAGEIPDNWRSAVITPAFKKGQKYVPANYRPISLTCICCKVIEHIVTSHIMRHAARNNILYPLQHGFRSKQSCETQLLECIDDLTMNLENGKLYGIRGSTNQWIQTFWYNRTQVVAVDGETSDKVHVEYRVLYWVQAYSCST